MPVPLYWNKFSSMILATSTTLVPGTTSISVPGTDTSSIPNVDWRDERVFPHQPIFLLLILSLRDTHGNRALQMDFRASDFWRLLYLSINRNEKDGRGPDGQSIVVPCYFVASPSGHSSFF